MQIRDKQSLGFLLLFAAALILVMAGAAWGNRPQGYYPQSFVFAGWLENAKSTTLVLANGDTIRFNAEQSRVIAAEIRRKQIEIPCKSTKEEEKKP